MKQSAKPELADMPKEPWLAVFLSTLFLGAGQIYADRKSRGIFFIFINIALFLILASSLLFFIFSANTATTSLLALFLAIASGFIIFIFGIYVLFNAHKVAKKYNAKHDLTLETDIKKKPWLAVFLSYLLPGIGQFYNKQVLKGLAFIIGIIVLLILENIHYLFAILTILLYFLAVKDAFEFAERINGTNKKILEQGSKGARIFVIVVILFGHMPFPDIVKAHFIQAYKFPSGSMIPSLLIGDHILIDKTSKDSTKRGDLIVFKYPEDPERDFIKRVIGLGGETIEARDKIIYINGKAIEEPYVQHTDNTIRPGGVEPRDNFGPIVIPEGKFFVMGDNRDQSYDSRYWGYVPKEYIKGKAFKIYWSWDSKNSKARWDRIGMEIR